MSQHGLAQADAPVVAGNLPVEEHAEAGALQVRNRQCQKQSILEAAAAESDGLQARLSGDAPAHRHDHPSHRFVKAPGSLAGARPCQPGGYDILK